MNRTMRSGWGLVALVAVFGACADDPAAPAQTRLSDAEAAALAEDQADLLDAVLDGEIDARPALTGLAGGTPLAFSAAPVVTEFEFTRTRPCRGDGQIVATGSGVHTADRMTGEVTLDFEGTKRIEDCVRTRGDVVLTINGGGTFEGHRMKLNGQYVGLQTNDQAGSFTWETSDGRSGECDYEIHVEWNPETHTKTVTGFVCDHEINRTVTRGRAAGDDASDG